MGVTWKSVLFTIIGIAGAFLIYSFYSAPDSPGTGADTFASETDQQISTADRTDMSNAYSSTQANNPAKAPGNEKNSNVGERNSKLLEMSSDDTNGSGVNPVTSFEDFMSVPGAEAQSYVLVDGAMNTNRLQEITSPEDFDRFAAYLERDANSESRATAEEYRTALFEAANDLSVSVFVRSVSCGTSLCAAKIQSFDTPNLDKYLASLRSSGKVPMYATMEMPPEANSGYDVRRIVFTTDPSAAAFEFTPE